MWILTCLAFFDSCNARPFLAYLYLFCFFRLWHFIVSHAICCVHLFCEASHVPILRNFQSWIFFKSLMLPERIVKYSFVMKCHLCLHCVANFLCFSWDISISEVTDEASQFISLYHRGILKYSIYYLDVYVQWDTWTSCVQKMFISHKFLNVFSLCSTIFVNQWMSKGILKDAEDFNMAGVILQTQRFYLLSSKTSSVYRADFFFFLYVLLYYCFVIPAFMQPSNMTFWLLVGPMYLSTSFMLYYNQ